MDQEANGSRLIDLISYRIIEGCKRSPRFLLHTQKRNEDFRSSPQTFIMLSTVPALTNQIKDYDMPTGLDTPVSGDKQTDLNSESAARMSLEAQAGNPTNAENKIESTAEQHLPPFEIVDIPGEDNLNLEGILWKPPGTGPFPTVLYNHGSEENVRDSNYSGVANYYVNNGFAFLLPLRRGHSFSVNDQTVATSDGILFDDRLSEDTPHDENWIKQQEVDNTDVEAAAKWLANQSYVDRGNMIMSGISFGGIQTCLSAEKGMGFRAFIPFAPAAMSWSVVPGIQQRLEQSLQNAQAPVFLLQAENDYSLSPSRHLGPVLDENGSQNRHKVYPSFEPERGHSGGHAGFALRGMEVWNQDLNDFLKNVSNGELPKLNA